MEIVLQQEKLKTSDRPCFAKLFFERGAEQSPEIPIAPLSPFFSHFPPGNPLKVLPAHRQTGQLLATVGRSDESC